jgi:2'-5' RNA ligase
MSGGVAGSPWRACRALATLQAMPDPGPRSGLIIEVPEAEHAVRRHRELLDASALLGVPAHITVLFPFVPPSSIGPEVRTALGYLFAGAGRFRFELSHPDWFGDDVLWLAPRDPGPFRALTERVFAAFPAFPPFEGQFDDVVPHLTIGHDRPVRELRAAEEAVLACLPIAATASAVTLMTQQSPGGHWTKSATFALG